MVHYCEDHTDALVLDAARNVFGADKYEVSLRGQLGGQGESVVHLEVGLYVKVLIF